MTNEEKDNVAELKAKIATLTASLADTVGGEPFEAPDRFADLDPDAEVEVIATGLGFMPINGLVKPDQPLTIAVSLFSENWMRPKAPKDAKIINPWMKAKRLAAEDARQERRKRINALASLKG